MGLLSVPGSRGALHTPTSSFGCVGTVSRMRKQAKDCGISRLYDGWCYSPPNLTRVGTQGVPGSLPVGQDGTVRGSYTSVPKASKIMG